MGFGLSVRFYKSRVAEQNNQNKSVEKHVIIDFGLENRHVIFSYP